MNSIENIIKDTVLKGTNASIKIDDSSFFSVLIEPNNTKKLSHSLLLLITLIFCIVFIFSSFVFFINDVLFYKNTAKVNSVGSIIPEKSCNRQSVLFLYNPADLWTNTGIQLQKEDKIKISVSGGFHSDIKGLINSVQSNGMPEYKWVSFYTAKKDTTNRKYYLYNKPDAYFGSVLYQIAGEMDPEVKNEETIFQVKCNENINIRDNGTLYLSVNDIFFTDKDFKTFEKDTTYAYLSNNRYACYNDNLGEVLVVIDIEKKLESYYWRSSWYRYTEKTMYDLWDNHSIAISILLTPVYLVWSILVLLWKVRYLSIAVAVLLLFFVYKKSITKLIKRLKWEKKV
ncbi:hypothetical protein EZS27_013278 [termite gut metagenome]|uniref:Uncharacterized protein n=1 Tax=termite gut metagenome TaxID=433724 RepID=A0A5J4RZQ8_9ZZZZ